MKFWLLSREECVYDEYIGFVICAETEEEARLLANGSARGEGGRVWDNPSRSTCIELNPENYIEPTIILADYDAG